MATGQIDQLKRAVEDARILLDFAVTSNRHVEDKVLDDVLKKTKDLGDLCAAQVIVLEKEAEFWKAYQG
jgi:ADP-dependent phosphofructokinase/glucokinase